MHCTHCAVHCLLVKLYSPLILWILAFRTSHWFVPAWRVLFFCWGIFTFWTFLWGFHFLKFFWGGFTLTFLSVVCGDFNFHFMKFFCGAIYKSFEYILLNLWTQHKIFRTWWKEWHFLFSAAATWLNFQRQNLAFSGQRCKYGNTSSASQKDIRITTRICKYWTH